MAFTTSIVVQGVSQGNQLTRVLNVTADAAEANIVTGLKKILYAQVTALSAATNANIRINADSSGVASIGVLGMSGCTSGNIYLVVAYGS